MVAAMHQMGHFGGVAAILTDDTSSDGKSVYFGSTINPSPTGPSSPASGWHVDLADDFNAVIGTGANEDNLWYPSQSWNPNPATNANGDNEYETEVYNSSQVSVSNGDFVQRNYVSGIVTTPTNQADYKGFT
jgi:hypothetical protein